MTVNIEYVTGLKSLASGVGIDIPQVVHKTQSTGTAKFVMQERDLTTTEEQIPVGELITPGLAVFANITSGTNQFDQTPVIQILDGPGGNVLTKIKPHERFVFRVPSSTLYAKTETLTGRLFALVIEE